MKKLLVLAFTKLIFFCAPVIAVVFAALYFFNLFLVSQGLKGLMFIPAASAIALAYYVCDLILGREMIEIKKLHKLKKMRG